MIITLQKIKTYIDKTIFIILTIIITAMFLLVLWQIFSRYVLKDPSVFTEEVVRFLLIWLGMLSIVYGFGSNKHISLTLLYGKASPSVKFSLDIFIHCLNMTFGGLVLIFGGLKTLPLASMQNSSILLIPMNYIYIVFPISGLILVVYEIINLIAIWHEYHQGEKI